MHEELRRHTTNEAFGVELTTTPLESVLEKRAREVFQANTRYLPDEKRFETSLLWANDEIEFPPSKKMAMKRLECAERRARKVQGGIEANEGFHIRGFLSNVSEIMQKFNPEKFEEVESLSMMDEKLMEKVLGMWWNIKDDTIRFKFKVNKVDTDVLAFTRPPTRSELLSIVMSVFDPMGFIAHYVSYAKTILREVVKLCPYKCTFSPMLLSRSSQL